MKVILPEYEGRYPPIETTGLIADPGGAWGGEAKRHYVEIDTLDELHAVISAYQIAKQRKRHADEQDILEIEAVKGSIVISGQYCGC